MTRPAWPWSAPAGAEGRGGPGRPTAPAPSTIWPSAPRRPPAGPTAGIGHTRWATHGRPTEENAHPHVDCSGGLALVHNGIIENHVELTDELVAAGHHLESETDTEVLAHLIEASSPPTPTPAWPAPCGPPSGRVRGAFSVAVVRADEPDLIVAARRVSPLLMGVTEDAAFLASDIPAILGLTREFFVLEDDQVAELPPGSVAGDRHSRGRGGAPDRITVELGPRRRPQGRLRRLHEQGDARAAQGGGRHPARPAAARRHPRPSTRSTSPTRSSGPSTRCSSWPAGAATTPA